jgi:uncharacterized membrane protein
MRHSDSLHQAMTTLRKNPVVILPPFLRLVLSLAVLWAVVIGTGAIDLFDEFTQLQKEYEESSQLQASYATFPEYAENRLDLSALMSAQALWWFVGGALVLFAITLVLGCMGFAVARMALDNQRITAASLLSNTLERLWPYVSARLLTMVAFLVPVKIGLILVVAVFALHPLTGLLLALIGIVAMISYAVFLMLRLLFASPSVFNDRLRGRSAVLHSYNITRKNIWAVVVVALIVLALSFLSGQVRQPFYASVIAAQAVLGWPLLVLAVVLSVIVAVIAAFEHLYLLSAYQAYATES